MKDENEKNNMTFARIIKHSRSNLESDSKIFGFQDDLIKEFQNGSTLLNNKEAYNLAQIFFSK